MVDSRQKGARAEAALVKLLKEQTGLNWKRTPGSGALHKDHLLKGDLYVPGEGNNYCVEVKHYKDDKLTSKVLTDKEPQLIQWWEQALRQGKETNKKPILFFKFDRSKWFVMMELPVKTSTEGYRCIKLPHMNAIIFSYDKWVDHVLQYIKWIK